MVEEKFIVLGSNSFSGACFIDYLLAENQAAQVIAISRSPENPAFLLSYSRHSAGRVSFYQLDLIQEPHAIVKLVDEFGADYIVNFAAQGMVAESWLAPEQWFKTNCLGPVELVHLLTKSGVSMRRFVQVSSPEVYGSINGGSETQAGYHPSTPYAASKAAGDLGLYPYFLNRGLPLIYTRATNVYGAFQQPYRIVPRTVLYLKQGRKILLHGGGRAIKSYIHIRDVCEATLRIARSGRSGEVYHISPDGGGISVYALVGMICAHLGKNVTDCVEMVDERCGQDDVYVISSDKLRNELGWRPKISLQTGIDEVVTWVEDNYQDLLNWPSEYVHKG